MKIKVYVIDFEFPPRVKKWGLRLGIPAVMLVGGGVAFAGLPGGYADGQPLTKAALDSNFNYLQNEIAGDGGVQGQIATLQGQVHSPSAFRAELTTATTIQTNALTSVAFNNVLYDVTSEYTAETGVFSPKQAGTYIVQCGFYFAGIDGVIYAAEIEKNGTEISDFNAQAGSTSGEGVSTATSGIFTLAAGDSLICGTYQQSGSTQSIVLNFADRNFFSAARHY